MSSGEPKMGPSFLDPVCAFPARYRVLLENGFIVKRDVTCEGLNYWKKSMVFDSVSLVYASAYDSNPASLFGHIFLKLNSNRGISSRNLLDYSLSFSAMTGESDGLSYMIKGLSGGFPGRFSLLPYYVMVNDYNLTENRSLWEYKIPLSPYQTSLLREHIWEMFHFASIDYYCG